MKKLISLILALTMLFSLTPSAFAAGRNFSREEKIASELKFLGLFKGVSETNFALGRAPTRVESLVMLIRLLGKETEALNFSGKHPFTDVPSWAEKYVAYGFEKKLTNGISKTKFGSGNPASAEMYLTFVLRALGYTDGAGADFEWDKPYALANSSGLLIGMPDCDNFHRADVVLISYAALGAKLKGKDKTLIEELFGNLNSLKESPVDRYNPSLLTEKTEEQTTVPSADSTFAALTNYIVKNDSGSASLPSVVLNNTDKNELYAVLYQENVDFLFSSYYLTVGEAQHVVSVMYNENDDTVQIGYVLSDLKTGAAYMEAFSKLKKADIVDGIMVTPDTLDVFADTTKTKEELSKTVSTVMTTGTFMSLSYTELVIDRNLGEDKSIADFGFTGLKFE